MECAAKVIDDAKPPDIVVFPSEHEDHEGLSTAVSLASGNGGVAQQLGGIIGMLGVSRDTDLGLHRNVDVLQRHSGSEYAPNFFRAFQRPVRFRSRDDQYELVAAEMAQHLSPIDIYPKMPGRQGGDRVTVQNLKVVQCRPEDNVILVSGAVPGAKGGYVMIRPAVKAPSN